MAMTEEQKAQLQKVDKKIRFLTNLRLAIIFPALIDVLIIFYGRKVAADAQWLIYFEAYSYYILGIAIFVVLITIIIRMILVAKHNSIVMKSRD
ncbi:MAG: hypothetical protein J1E61_07425 [Lachnospiraceae bacterium]|nr:hypothetical protein [Lachnospiraceae bacterium]